MNSLDKTVCEPNRLHMLCSLRSGKRSFSDLKTKLGMTDGCVSMHMKILHKAGLVSRELVFIDEFKPRSVYGITEKGEQSVSEYLKWVIDLANSTEK